MPPPPAQMTTAPWSSSQVMGWISRICWGWGLGGGHDAAPAGAVLAEGPAFLGGQRVGGVLVVNRADEFGGAGEGGVGGVHGDHGQDGGDLDLGGQQVAQFLLDQVADHALGAGVQHVQRVGLGAGIGFGLQGQQADLGPVAVYHHDGVRGGQRRDRLRRDLDVAPLDLGGHRVRTAQQRITAQRDHDPHTSLPSPAHHHPACLPCQHHPRRPGPHHPGTGDNSGISRRMFALFCLFFTFRS
jgi:hypothetical protein